MGSTFTAKAKAYSGLRQRGRLQVSELARKAGGATGVREGAENRNRVQGRRAENLSAKGTPRVPQGPQTPRRECVHVSEEDVLDGP